MSFSAWPPEGFPLPWNLPEWISRTIPYMDVMQYIYDNAKNIVNMMPHQPPVYTRQVDGIIKLLGAGGMVPLPLGSVGYDAETKEVIWTVSEAAGWRAQSARFPVQSILPILFQLLCMVPWDGLGVADQKFEEMAHEKRLEEVPPASDMTSWLYNKAKTFFSGAPGVDIVLPQLNGATYPEGAPITENTLLPSVHELVVHTIPVMDLCQAFYEAAMELVERINHHPPQYSRTVFGGGVKVAYKYSTRDKATGIVTESSDMPPVSLLAGKEFKLEAIFSDDQYIDTRILLSQDFGTEETFIVFTDSQSDPAQYQADPTISVGLSLPPLPGLNIPHSVQIVEIITQGRPELKENPDDPDEITQTGIPSSFRARVHLELDSSVKPATPQEWPVPLPPLSYNSSSTQHFTYYAQERQVTGATIGMEIVAGFPGRTFVDRIVRLGADPPSDAADPGAPIGERAAIRLAWYNDTPDPIEIIASDTLPRHINVAGEIFLTQDTISASPNNPYVLPPGSPIQYEAAFAEGAPTSIMSIPLAEAVMEFTSSMVQNVSFTHWTGQSTAEYVGNEFSMSWLTDPTKGVRRYLAARLRYKRYGDVVDGVAVPDNEWTQRYSGDGADSGFDGAVSVHEQVPVGINPIARLQYDAVKKAVTVQDLISGSAVTMRVNMCAWFMFNLLTLIPMRIL